jgi:amino acid transporter
MPAVQLPRALRLRDIVLLNVTAIIGLRWISLAAAGGNTSLTLWLLALLLFFLPQAFAVVELTTRLPGEGGIYLWTKTAFGDFHGFLSGWCYWTNNLVYFPNLLVYLAGISVFVVGPGFQAVGESKTYVLIFSLLALWTVLLFNYFGLKVGRWVANAGGLGTWMTGTVLILFGLVAAIRYGAANPLSANSFFQGLLHYDKLTFWASICFAFSGLELASVLSGEVRDPVRTIPQAVVISGVIIAGIYIFGTLAVLVALPARDISVITGFLQAIAAIGERLGLGWTANLLALLITLGGIGGLMAWFTGAARMPFVAGIDRYLPPAFGKIHPRYGSPYVAVTIQAGIATLFVLMSFVGSTVETAYLVLLDTTLLVYFVPYAYMFLAYLVLRRQAVGSDHVLMVPKNHIGVWFFGLAGLGTTLLAIVFSLIPPVEVDNAWLYEMKVVGGFLLFVVTGALFYLREKRKSLG